MDANRKPTGLVLTISEPNLLPVTCEVILDSGCVYTLWAEPEPEQAGVTVVVVTGTVDQLRACHSAGQDKELWR